MKSDKSYEKLINKNKFKDKLYQQIDQNKLRIDIKQ